MNKKVLICGVISAIALSSSINIPRACGTYDMRPKNSFRGGSIKKGGKVKCPRR